MKKMKKLNLNKVRIVSLKNLQRLHGGGETDACPTSKYSVDPIVDCNSTGPTHGGNDGGTFSVDPLGSNACDGNASFILTECELRDTQ